MKTFVYTLVSFVALTVPAWSEDVVVVQQHTQFSETTVSLKPGDNLVFKNADDFSHNLFSLTPGVQFSPVMQKPGDRLSVPISKEGDFTVNCAIHPKMKLLVKVRK